MSAKEILSALGLKDRKNFLNLYLIPSVSEGYLFLLYPDSPHHHRQKYSLTSKGLALYGEIAGVK